MKKSALSLILTLLVSIVCAAMPPEAWRSFKAFEQRAEAGDPEAQFRLSAILEQGYDSIPVDSARALRLVMQSADTGYPPALNYLGFLYGKGYVTNGDTLLRANRDSMIHYIIKAAGLNDPKATANLAYLLLQDSTFVDSGGSVKTRECGVQITDSAGCVESQGQNQIKAKAYAMLGHAYAHGIGVQYNHREANRSFAKAAILGDPAASYIMAETLEIFPDALTDLLTKEEQSQLPDKVSLRKRAEEAGITTADQARKSLLP